MNGMADGVGKRVHANGNNLDHLAPEGPHSTSPEVSGRSSHTPLVSESTPQQPNLAPICICEPSEYPNSDHLEPILQPNEDRFSVFPIRSVGFACTRQ
jgi:hypothetical protein